jgi:hypothetical protein
LRPTALALLLGIVLAAASAAEDAGHGMTPDDLGRVMHGAMPAMDPALVQELKDKVPRYRGMSNSALARSMEMMGPDYAWAISPPGLRGERGLLILTHGFGDAGDRLFRARVQPLADGYPTVLGVGMAMMMSMHIQAALDRLVAAGAREVVVLPVVASASSELYRQWLYIFGRQYRAEFATVPRVRTAAALRIVPPPGDDPLVAGILLDYAREISTDPAREVVVIVGHGPSSAADNAAELATLARLAGQLRAAGGFADAAGATLQDDAPDAVRAANVARLRGMLEGATAAGRRVLVVTNLISARGIQARLRADLRGLDFRFNDKGLVDSDKLVEWMREALRRETGMPLSP